MAVPQYEELTIKEFYSFAQGYPNVIQALPEVEQEIFKLPRQYLINVIFSIVGQPFRNWVIQKQNARHQKVADEKDMYIQMDPEIAAIYKQSQAVSTNNGSSY